MYADKLLKLANIVERAVEQQGVKFDFKVYAVSSGTFDLSCGTTACMAGIAALSGEFPGLKLESRRDFIDPLYGRIAYPQSENAICCDAMVETFGLTLQEANYLFQPLSYAVHGLEIEGPVAARHGIRRIRDFVAAGGMPSPESPPKWPYGRRYH